MGEPGISSAIVELRRQAERGITSSGGLEGRHHFSFAGYQRPDRIEWGCLRALHHYRLAPGEPRAPSFHAGFEIVTLVTAGALRRTGSFAPRQLLLPGSIELVSAGVGANLGLEAVGDEPAVFTEIWIQSERPMMNARRQWLPARTEADSVVLATGESARAPRLAADAELTDVRLAPGAAFGCVLGEDDCAYLSLTRGRLRAGDALAEAGDALAIAGPGRFAAVADGPARFLFIRCRRGG